MDKLTITDLLKLSAWSVGCLGPMVLAYLCGQASKRDKQDDGEFVAIVVVMMIACGLALTFGIASYVAGTRA